MDGVKVAWRSFIAAHKFLFWALIEAATQAIYWHKEASRELLILKPRRPKDLYDTGYVLFAYSIVPDAWAGYWRAPDAQGGMAPDLAFEIEPQLWGNVPFHEVEFSAMPEITFKVRAVALDWCKEHLKKPSELKMPEVAVPMADDPVEVAKAQVEANEQPVRH